MTEQELTAKSHELWKRTAAFADAVLGVLDAGGSVTLVDTLLGSDGRVVMIDPQRNRPDAVVDLKAV